VHAAHPSDLYSRFPWGEAAILIAELSVARAEFASFTQSREPADLKNFICGWDGALLLADDFSDPELNAIVQTTLAVRVALASITDLQTTRFGCELHRLISAVGAMPPARVALTEADVRRLTVLPAAWQSVVNAALRSPELWTIKKVHHACGVDRRTLERGFARVGLPAPAALLGKRTRA